MIIRPEADGDRAAVFNVVKAAFGRDSEARLVDALRQSSAYVPELSLVALERASLSADAASAPDLAPEADSVVGHILFTRIAIRNGSRLTDALALAPVAVVPGQQKRGVGSALIRRGLDDATQLDHRIVIVVGHPEYYPRFGFVPASTFGISVPFDAPDEAVMALALRPDALIQARGTVEYPSEFLQS